MIRSRVLGWRRFDVVPARRRFDVARSFDVAPAKGTRQDGLHRENARKPGHEARPVEDVAAGEHHGVLAQVREADGARARRGDLGARRPLRVEDRGRGLALLRADLLLRGRVSARRAPRAPAPGLADVQDGARADEEQEEQDHHEPEGLLRGQGPRVLALLLVLQRVDDGVRARELAAVRSLAREVAAVPPVPDALARVRLPIADAVAGRRAQRRVHEGEPRAIADGRVQTREALEPAAAAAARGGAAIASVKFLVRRV
mmetsp:Transcript_11157/g.33290  ORF Transcript_11157/g.33290 Transcript_11157/m.33290 type:complete len:259 (-) Transcript_11157:284-1060(-)